MHKTQQRNIQHEHTHTHTKVKTNGKKIKTQSIPICRRSMKYSSARVRPMTSPFLITLHQTAGRSDDREMPRKHTHTATVNHHHHTTFLPLPHRHNLPLHSVRCLEALSHLSSCNAARLWYEGPPLLCSQRRKFTGVDLAESGTNERFDADPLSVSIASPAQDSCRRWITLYV